MAQKKSFRAKLPKRPSRQVAMAEAAKPKPSVKVFQFKITLLGIKPPIWRRIQVRNGTLDKLHEHIQTSMGWTNSYSHHFILGEQLYGDPMLIEEIFEVMQYEDSTTTKLSDILPKAGTRYYFWYEYDFGDSWEHEILLEGRPAAKAGCSYPICLEGERACPPEDVGGSEGYAHFLEAIGDKGHPEYRECVRWVGGGFDPEDFDAAKATKAMKNGLPDWRTMSF